LCNNSANFSGCDAGAIATFVKIEATPNILGFSLFFAKIMNLNYPQKSAKIRLTEFIALLPFES